MQKWTSLLALALIVGCAATPQAPTTMQLEAASTSTEDRHVQQIFGTPTPIPTTTLNPLEAAKSNKLLDLCVAEVLASEKELNTRLAKERDRVLLVFARPDPYTGLAVSPNQLLTYENGLNRAITQTTNSVDLIERDLAAARNRDNLTVRKAIITAKTDWYKARLDGERLALFYRTNLAAHYQRLQVTRRKQMK